MKLFDEEKLSRLKREMLSVIKRESQDQEEKIEDLCKELVHYFKLFFSIHKNSKKIKILFSLPEKGNCQ